MREIKFRVWDDSICEYWDWDKIKENLNLYNILDMDGHRYTPEQYTGLKDKNGKGLTEVYEGDIIGENNEIRGNIHEIHPRKTDVIIPQMGTRKWNVAYKKAMDRGYNFAQ